MVPIKLGSCGAISAETGRYEKSEGVDTGNLWGDNLGTSECSVDTAMWGLIELRGVWQLSVRLSKLKQNQTKIIARIKCK